MTKSGWVVIVVLLLLGFAAAAWTDKGSWLNAVVTGACNACPAPPQCRGNPGGGGRYRGPPSIDGCNPPWWKHHS